MAPKKWLIAFCCTGILLLGAMVAFNVLIDPFGIFGDRILGWHSYNATQNPRTAKIAFINRYHESFDSFIVGPSGASAFPVAMLDAHFDAHFFNMFAFGGDMRDIDLTAQYLMENFEVQNLVLSIYIDSVRFYSMDMDPLSMGMHADITGDSRAAFLGRYLFLNPRHAMEKLQRHRQRGYLPGAFDWFDMSTGAYDKRTRAAEPIGCLDAYLQLYPQFLTHHSTTPIWMSYTQELVSRVQSIYDTATAQGVNLIVVFNPIFSDHFMRFNPYEVAALFSGIAEVTPFWNFSMSSISFDPRFFYDPTHFREAVGTMALGRIFGYGHMYIPPDFGTWVTTQNADAHARSLFYAQPQPRGTNVPILMYHHLAEVATNPWTVTPEAFAAQMRALRDNGFTAITLRQLVDYVDYGMPLPERPVLITFDDGYLSVYQYAFPILQYYGHVAVSFVMGFAVGTDTYKDTGNPTTPKFCFDQARNMAGIMCIQSHSYDMHQWAPFETGRARENIMRWEDECEFEYAARLRADHARISQLIYDNLGEAVFAIAYPHGVYDTLAQAILVTEGVRVTLTTRTGTNVIVPGLPQSLLSLNRFNITDDVCEDELMWILHTE